MPPLKRIASACYSLIRKPFEIIVIFGLKLAFRIRNIFGSKYRYQSLSTSLNQLRLLRILPPFTSCPEEPIRCELQTVSLNDLNPYYETWLKTADPALPPRQQTREWYAYAEDKNKKEPGYKLGRFQWGDFYAISYTWGPTDLSNSIILEGHLFKVPHSVESILRRFRATTTKHQLIWIDFLSINQQDSEDKISQIKRMQTIFSSAGSVVVHLGDGSPDSDLAMDLINKVAYNAMRGFDYKSFLVDKAGEVAQGIPFEDQKAYGAVCSLFMHPYWGRMWVIQELAMGDDLTPVLCGTKLATLQNVRIMMKVVIDNSVAIGVVSDSADSPFFTTRSAPAIGLMFSIGRLRQHYRQRQANIPITYRELRSPALSLAQAASVTHIYDKVFGMLGLLPKNISADMEKVLEELTSVTQEIAMQQNGDIMTSAEATYVGKVYTKFAKSIIRRNEDLDVIFARNTFQDQHSKLGLPTWVTDWSLQPDRSGTVPPLDWNFSQDEHIWRTTNESEQENITLLSRSYTCAVGSKRADAGRVGDIQFSSDEKFLFCQGLLISSIDGVAPEWPALNHEDRSRKINLSEEMIQSRVRHSPYGDEKETANALLRTMLFDPMDENDQKSAIFSVPWFGEEADENAAAGHLTFEERSVTFLRQLIDNGWDGRLFLGPMGLFEELRRRLGSFQIGGKAFKDYFPSEIGPCKTRPSDNDLHVAIGNFQRRRLVTTQTGHFGLAPSIVKPGDEIFVLLGCSCPVILRKCPVHRGYEVVGECYVEGFMKGECMDEIDEGKTQLQNITLC
ncbi:hypothetical protein CC78DRAFT_208662 [Lojkania enalia]|uniref:Heterokaryon incompatibility domain-containing protein n=1 Tax=Lojkania enalia TaxID=147567 RepID=A0A9P4N4T8_9PLEO|nr:hypothetical protein CC78DRAFT_208662 [Didymosphaeria enalia]